MYCSSMSMYQTEATCEYPNGQCDGVQVTDPQS